MKQNNFLIILILGALETVTPFSIDMYLPSFSEIAADLGTNTARVALSLSSYFVAMAIGQIFYGPFLDRFGRKKPIYIGLVIYILASVGCISSRSVEWLIIYRFIQALGGSVASVAAVAMVHDFFPAKEGAKVFSLMMLILGSSPLLAPSVGGFVTAAFGWHAVFIIMASLVFIILLVTMFLLPEGHQPDPSISLKIKPIILNFVAIFKEPQFYTYALAGAFSFAGLFAYVASSPAIFMDVFHLSAKAYGGVFALLSIGFIGASQVNIWLLRYYSSEQIFKRTLWCQLLLSIVFVTGSIATGFGLIPTILIFFGFLACTGLIYPNAAALSLMAFTKNAGSASALLGFLQIGLGALASAIIGMFKVESSLPTAAIFIGSVSIAGLILLLGRRAMASQVFRTEALNPISEP